MRSKDIQPGRFYRVRYQRFGGEVPTGLVRVERVEPPRYEGDTVTIVATTFQARGPFESRHQPRDVLAEEKPTDRMLRIMAACEQEGAT